MPRIAQHPAATPLFLFLAACLVAGCVEPPPDPPVETAAGEREVEEPPPPGPPVAERPLLAGSTLARQALERGDWPAARAHLEAVLAHAPNLPQSRLRLAEVIARQGDLESALEHLRALVEIGAVIDLESSEMFAPFLDLPEFAEVAAALGPRQPSPAEASRVETLATLPADQWTEGIAYDPVTGDLFAGSLERHHVLRIAPDGTLTDFVRDDSAGLPSLVGLTVDAERRHLWVVAGAGSDRPAATVPRANALVKYHLDDGRRLAIHFPGLALGAEPTRDAEPNGAHRLLNDVAVAPDGTVYATESFESAIWRLVPGGALERWRVFPEMAYLNGIAVAEDGSRLYAAALEGLVQVDLATGKAGRVPAVDTVFAGLGDGLALAGDALVLVQNSDILGQRVARFRLDPTGRRVVEVESLPFTWPDGLLPYTVAVGGRSLFVVATADLARRDASGPVPAPIVFRLPLDS